MTVAYGNDAFSILVFPTKKMVLQFFQRGFRFPENRFQSKSD